MPTFNVVYRSDGTLATGARLSPVFNPAFTVVGTTPPSTSATAGSSVFGLAPNANGVQAATVLASFAGDVTEFPLVSDAQGDLFATVLGNATLPGQVVELARTAGGYGPATTVLSDPVGARLTYGLAIDAAGDLFGETSTGGAFNQGVLFELPFVAGAYAAAPVTLFSFDDATGAPVNGLTIDQAGDLFGSQRGGGSNGGATFFALSKGTGGYAATETILGSALESVTTDPLGDVIGYDYGQNAIVEYLRSGGTYARQTLVSSPSFAPEFLTLDAAGDIFGTTLPRSSVDSLGVIQASVNGGTVFEIAKTGAGYATSVKTVYALGSADGSNPTSLVADSSGTLFGVAQGTNAAGVSPVAEVFSLSDSGYAASVPTDTVQGPAGGTLSIAFGAATLAALAAPLLAQVTPVNAVYATSGGTLAVTSGLSAAVVAGPQATTVLGGAAAGETIAAGQGDLTFVGGPGGGTLLAGAGNDAVFLGAANWSVALGGGVDTIVAGAGSSTIATGFARSLVFLGAGASSVASAGADTIVGGAGVATVAPTGGNGDLVFGGTGALTFLAGEGTSTVVAGAGPTSVVGDSSGGSLAFANGPLQFVGNGGIDTVVGLGGSVTVHAGSNGGLFAAGSGGGSQITAAAGSVTAFGAADGDVLTATGTDTTITTSGPGARFTLPGAGYAVDLFVGGSGAETMTAAGSTALVSFLAGSGPETLVGGGGQTAMVAGAGADLLAGGAGATLFAFFGSRTGGATDTVTGFDPSHDFIRVDGYATAAADVLQNATVVNGSTMLSLGDGTQVIFAGVAALNPSSLV